MGLPFCSNRGHFGELELETVRAVDADAMFLAGDGIEDRFAAGSVIPGTMRRAAALVDVDVEVDVGEHRIVHLFQRRSENVEDRGAGIGVLAGENAQQRVALGLVGPLVDDERRLAVAFMDGTRPFEDAGDLEPVEFDVP